VTAGRLKFEKPWMGSVTIDWAGIIEGRFQRVVFSSSFMTVSFHSRVFSQLTSRWRTASFFFIFIFFYFLSFVGRAGVRERQLSSVSCCGVSQRFLQSNFVLFLYAENIGEGKNLTHLWNLSGRGARGSETTLWMECEDGWRQL
jgi:hypothetical protein